MILLKSQTLTDPSVTNCWFSPDIRGPLPQAPLPSFPFLRSIIFLYITRFLSTHHGFYLFISFIVFFRLPFSSWLCMPLVTWWPLVTAPHIQTFRSPAIYAPRAYLGYALLRHILGIPQVRLVTLGCVLFHLLTHICLVSPCNQWSHTDVLLQVDGLLYFVA